MFAIFAKEHIKTLFKLLGQMMELDKFIIYASVGAVFLSALYHTFFYIKRKEILFLRYAMYLWASLFTQCIAAFSIANKNAMGAAGYISIHITILVSYYFYFRFVGHAFGINKKENKLNGLFLQLIYVLILLLMVIIISSELFFTRDNIVAGIAYSFLGMVICIVGLYFCIYYFKSSKSNFIRVMALGSLCLTLFNIYYCVYVLLFDRNNPVRSFSIGSQGLFVEIVIYTIALAIKTNDDLKDKVDAMQKLNEFQQVLLAAELEKQELLYTGRQNERKRISREMHDELSNALVGLKFYISDVRGKQPDADRQLLFKNIEEEVQYVYVEARNYMHKLNSSVHEHQYDLVAFLQNIHQRFSKSTLQVKIVADYKRIDTKLNIEEKNVVYLLLKEALTNTMKHAKASEVSILCYFEAEHFFTVFTDNGTGIGSYGGSGIGIKNMEERVAFLNGALLVQGSAAGTTIQFNFLSTGSIIPDVSHF